MIVTQPQFSHVSNQNYEPKNATNIILLSLDGFSRERFNEYKDNLTTINALMSQGWSQFNVTNYAYFTQTRSGHATMLSGYLGTDTGVYGNSYIYNQVPVGYTFLEKIEEKLGEDQIATAFISGSYKINYPFNQTALDKMDYLSIEDQKSNETGDSCLSYLEKFGHTHFAAFFHFKDPDKTGHNFSEGSEEWIQSLSGVDEQVNRIIT